MRDRAIKCSKAALFLGAPAAQDRLGKVNKIGGSVFLKDTRGSHHSLC